MDSPKLLDSLPEIFAACCGRDGKLWLLAQPFAMDGFAWACNSEIIVRAPLASLSPSLVGSLRRPVTKGRPRMPDLPRLWSLWSGCGRRYRFDLCAADERGLVKVGPVYLMVSYIDLLRSHGVDLIEPAAAKPRNVEPVYFAGKGFEGLLMPAMPDGVEDREWAKGVEVEPGIEPARSR
jgi:hypothetical protein